MYGGIWFSTKICSSKHSEEFKETVLPVKQQEKFNIQ
jgi:hypothetical protein